MEEKSKSLWERRRKIIGKVVLAVIFMLVSVAIVSQAFQNQNVFQPNEENMAGDIKENHVIFSEEQQKNKEQEDVSGDSDVWEKDKSIQDKLDMSQIPDSSALFERNQKKLSSTNHDYSSSKRGKKMSVNIKKKTETGAKGRVKVPSGHGEGNGKMPKPTEGAEGEGSKPHATAAPGAGDGTGTPHPTQPAKDNSEHPHTTTHPTSRPTASARPTPKPTPKPKPLPPEPTPSVPKGDAIYESIFRITEFPQNGVSEDEEKLHFIVIPILNEDSYHNYLYYNSELDAEKLLSSVLVYVANDEDRFKYRISSYGENFRIGEFPDIAKEDFTVTFYFRQHTSANWQEQKYTFDVSPYRYFVVNYKDKLIGNVTPLEDENVYNLLSYYEELLPEEQQEQLNREDGIPITEYTPGWKDEEGEKLCSDLYVAQKGWKAFYPLGAVEVPEGYEVRMKWFYDMDIDFYYPANVKQLQTLTKIPDNIQSLEVMQGIHRVNLTDARVENLILPSSVAVVDRDGLIVERSYQVDENNPFFTEKDDLLYNKDMTEIVGIPACVEELDVPMNVSKVQIPKENNIHKLVFESQKIPTVPVENLSDSVICVPSEFYDDYVSAWESRLPKTVSIIAEEKKDRVVRDGAILSPDGTILYRILSSVKGNYTVPDGVKIIKENAMNDASQIYHLILPKSILNIESKGLCGENLQTLVLLGEDAPIVTGQSIRKDKKVEIHVPSKALGKFDDLWTSWTILGKELSLNERKGYRYLKENEKNILLSVPNTLQCFDETDFGIEIHEIGPGAFSMAEQLVVADLSETVEKVHPFAFDGCQDLQIILCHQKDKITIANQAFEGTPSLRVITYDAAQAVFENKYRPDIDCFCVAEGEGYPEFMANYPNTYGLTGATDYFWEGTVENGIYVYGKHDKNGFRGTYLVNATDNVHGELDFRKDMTEIIFFALKDCKESMTVDFSKYENLVAVDESAFENSGLSGTLVLTDNIQELQSRVFAGCVQLEKIVIESDSLKTLPSGIFEGCVNAMEVTFGKSCAVERIEADTFSMMNLQSITLPDSLDTLEAGAFRFDKDLETITFTSSTPAHLLEDSILKRFTFGQGVSESLQIVVPTGYEQIYLEEWKDYFGGEDILKKYLKFSA